MKKNKYLKLILLISGIIILSVLCTAIITSKYVATMSPKVETKDALELEDRLYDNAEIVSCSGGVIHYKWNGQDYKCSGVLARDYIGVADIEVKNHEIVCVRIRGRQNFHKQENIGVVIKSSEGIHRDSICLRGDGGLLLDGKKIGKNEINISTYMSKHKKKKITVTSQNGGMYFGASKSEIAPKAYEGKFVVYKDEEGYVLVNQLGMEDYIRYVLPSEMPTSFAKEALKAQAVCARTFAYAQMQNNTYSKYGANLDDSTAFQVYNAGGSFEETDEAVYETEGEVIWCGDELAECYYFSTSPGKTEDMEVWGTDTPSYIHKTTSKDTNSPFYSWCAKLGLNRYYDQSYGKLQRLEVLRVSDCGYVTKLSGEFETGTVTYEKENDIRFFLGKYLESVTLGDGTVREDLKSVPSAHFRLQAVENGYILKGSGFGHGIGMSQYGAQGMAQKGKNYKDIIQHYYTNIEIEQIGQEK